MAVQLIHTYLGSPQPSVSSGPPPAEQNILALAEQPDERWYEPNYDHYLTTATQLQRWRDFLSHVTAYVVVNTIFIALWAKPVGRGFFWPAFPLIGWESGSASNTSTKSYAGRSPTPRFKGG